MRKRGNTGSPSTTTRSAETGRYAKSSRKRSSAIFISEKQRSEKNPNPKHARHERGIDRDSCELVR
jgi:hypothetical protein